MLVRTVFSCLFPKFHEFLENNSGVNPRNSGVNPRNSGVIQRNRILMEFGHAEHLL